jgi:hypothetical protein
VIHLFFLLIIKLSTYDLELLNFKLSYFKKNTLNYNIIFTKSPTQWWFAVWPVSKVITPLGTSFVPIAKGWSVISWVLEIKQVIKISEWWPCVDLTQFMKAFAIAKISLLLQNTIKSFNTKWRWFLSGLIWGSRVDTRADTTLKTGDKLRCSGRVSCSCSTSDTRRVTLIMSIKQYRACNHIREIENKIRASHAFQT